MGCVRLFGRPIAITYRKHILKVRDGKGGKDRILWVSEDLRDLVGRWRRRRSDGPWLFSTRTGNRTNPRSIRRTFGAPLSDKNQEPTTKNRPKG